MKVMRALSRLRALKGRMRKFPKENVREYRDNWEEKLGARGKAWNWRDVARAIGFGKYRSMLRIYVACGAVEELLHQGQVDIAHAQLIQVLKALHQFSVDGSWKTAWPLTFLADPVDRERQGGTEVELEGVLSYLKVQDELRRKTRGPDPADEEEEEEEEPRRRPKGRAKAKAKSASEQ
jgi:hypothetical protein